MEQTTDNNNNYDDKIDENLKLEEEQRPLGLPKKKQPKVLGGRLAELKFQRTKSSSTSTLYINSTVSTPDVDELLWCTAITIHKHMEEGLVKNDKLYFDIFNEKLNPINIDKYDNFAFPDVYEIYQFVESIFNAEKLSAECAIMMLAYIERMINLTGITIDGSNWRRVILSTLILASKVWEDQAVWNVDFISLFPSVTVKDLGQLEKVLLRLLQYNVSINASLYAKYYFELRSLSEKDSRNFPLEPLDKDGAGRLESRSQTEEERAREAYDSKAKRLRSKSLNQLAKGSKSPPVILN